LGKNSQLTYLISIAIAVFPGDFAGDQVPVRPTT